MKKLLFASTAALLMSGFPAFADDPVNQNTELDIQAIGSHAGLGAADVGYVPPEVVAAQRRATERRLKQLAAAHAVSDVGYVPPEALAAQRQGRHSKAAIEVSDVGYVPPEYIAEQRLALLREEKRLERRLTALRQARRSFNRPVADVGYVPPEYLAAQGAVSLRHGESTSTSEVALAAMPAPAAMDTECPAE